MKFLALVVLYRVEPDQAPTLVSLAHQASLSDIHVVVRDNSPVKATEESQLWLSKTFPSLDYDHDGDNWPLSRVYNWVIDHYLKGSPAAFHLMIFLDQDSVLLPDFVAEAAAAAAANPEISMFLPSVIAGGRIISPAHLYYFKGIYAKGRYSGKVAARFKTAINSGMVVSVGYLIHKFVGYPTELKFYGTDNWFCERFAEREKWIYVFDSTIAHDLSSLAEETNEVKLWRHREAIRAMRFLNRSGRFRNFACLVYAFAMSARQALRHRDWRFLQC